MRVFGPVPIPGLDHVPVEDLVVARLLGDADGRINGVGVSLSTDGRLRAGAAPGLVVEPFDGDLATALAVAAGQRPTTVEIDIEVEPLPAATPTAAGPAFDVPSDRRIAVLAGPGVLRGGHLDELRRLATDLQVGVLNTWGAKGVFRWDSPHHLGTAGLQERDFEMGGLGEADLILAVGIDPAEAPPDLLPDVEVREVDLGSLTWDPVPEREIARPPLYTDLSAAVMPAYEDESVPLHPARAIRELTGELAPGALVVADPGPAGLWVARAFPTTEPGSVIVPAHRAPGFAAAAALVAALDGRSAVAITTAPVGEETLAVLAQAERMGIAIDLRVWGEDPEVDFSRTQDLVEIAGPVVAWTRG